jgi:hypothetical protein
MHSLPVISLSSLLIFLLSVYGGGGGASSSNSKRASYSFIFSSSVHLSGPFSGLV